MESAAPSRNTQFAKSLKSSTAIMLSEIGDVDALAQVLGDDRINALCLGPGLGVGDDRAPLVEAALKSGARHFISKSLPNSKAIMEMIAEELA